MLYDANLRLNDDEPPLQEVDFNIVELIRRNENEELVPGKRVRPLTVTLRKHYNTLIRGVVMSLPMAGDCGYCLTDPNDPRNISGGFLFEENQLLFVERLVNLEHDRDAYRQIPLPTEGRYVTDDSFEEIIRCFEEDGIPLYSTSNPGGNIMYYDKKSWPNGTIPILERMAYEEAFEQLRRDNKE